MKAAVDIGTNSMRLLVVDDQGFERGRWARVTGLGNGVDASGRLADDAIERTVAVLAEYGRIMSDAGVDAARAVATSASRDAENREDFFDQAERALGVRPDMIPGTEEAALSFHGATAGASGRPPYLVVDIGGGSTEFVYERSGEVVATSVDIGSVRLTDRMLAERPVPFDRFEEASIHVEKAISVVDMPSAIGTCIGVAGTWTSLSAIAQELPAYDRDRVHDSVVTRTQVDHVAMKLATMSIEETAAIPALDPARAPVILAGIVVAREVMRYLSLSDVTVSEHDLLDGVVASL